MRKGERKKKKHFTRVVLLSSQVTNILSCSPSPPWLFFFSFFCCHHQQQHQTGWMLQSPMRQHSKQRSLPRKQAHQAARTGQLLVSARQTKPSCSQAVHMHAPLTMHYPPPPPPPPPMRRTQMKSCIITNKDGVEYFQKHWTLIINFYIVSSCVLLVLVLSFIFFGYFGRCRVHSPPWRIWRRRKRKKYFVMAPWAEHPPPPLPPLPSPRSLPLTLPPLWPRRNIQNRLLSLSHMDIWHGCLVLFHWHVSGYV